MKPLFISLFILSFIAGNVLAENTEDYSNWISDELGEFIITPMKNAPYPHASRKDGYKRDDTFYSAEEHYMDSSIGILIPSGYAKTDTVDVMIHFHGHGNNVAKQVMGKQLREMLNASGKNLIMIVPQGPKDARDSSCGKIEDQDGMKNLIMECLAFLKKESKTSTETPGKIIVSGHSGGFLPVAACLDAGGMDEHISDVFLMDASYARLESYSGWAGRSKGRLLSICTDHLLEENFEIMRNLQKEGITQFSILLDEDVTPEALTKHRAAFIHTKLTHKTLMYETGYLKRFMATSKVQNKPVKKE